MCSLHVLFPRKVEASSKDGGGTRCKEPASPNQHLEDSSWLSGSNFYFVIEIFDLFVTSAGVSLTQKISKESHYRMVVLNPGCILQTPWKLKKDWSWPRQLNLNHWEGFRHLNRAQRVMLMLWAWEPLLPVVGSVILRDSFSHLPKTLSWKTPLEISWQIRFEEEEHIEDRSTTSLKAQINVSWNVRLGRMQALIWASDFQSMIHGPLEVHRTLQVVFKIKTIFTRVLHMICLFHHVDIYVKAQR